MSDIINIRFPVPPVWWITWTDNTENTVLGYGYTRTSEVLSTTQHFTTYVDETVWKSTLLEHGVDPDPDPQPEPPEED